MKKLFTLLIVLFLWAGSSWGQTTLLSPTGDGGFETGNTPALNNWTAIASSTDTWVVGAVPVASAGTKCGYISSNGGAAWTYSLLSTIEHMYYDVTIPAGQNKVTLSFKWKAGGEGTTTSDWDNMKVFFGVSSSMGVPVANTAVSATYQISGPGAVNGMYKLSSAAWNTETISVPGTPGSTYRLVFSWKSDVSTIANPPCAIDEVSLVSGVASSITSTSVGGLWSSAATWVGGIVPSADNVTVATGATVVVNQSAAIQDLTVDGKLQWITTTTPSSTVNLLLANNITVSASGKLYAHATPLLGATIKITGNFINNGTVNLAAPASGLYFIGTTGTQTLGGTGTFIADMTGRGMIANLLFSSLAACDITTSQNLVTGNLAHTAGSLNTNGKISADNTAICFGGLINRSITTVTVNTMGAGYTSAPTVAFTAAPAGGITATGTANFDAATGTVRSITITNPGDGYRATPTITLTGGGFTTAATAVASLYQVFNFGTNSLGQKSAIASVTGALTIKSDQSVGSVWVTNGGAGYTSAPTVGFSLPTGYLNLVTSPGSGYAAAPTVTVTGGGGTGAVATAIVCRGQVVSVNITTAGTGYTSTPTFVFSSGAATAAFPAGAIPTATATIDPALGMVTSFTITNGGSGYTAAPTVTLTGGGFTTAATGPTARIGLYNLTLSYFSPATSNAVHTESVFIPANRRINILALNSATGFGLNLTGDLELYNTAPLTLTGNLDMGGNALTFSHPAYVGSSGGTTAYVSNGKITYKLFGATTSQTRTFPFNSYDGISGFNNHLLSMGSATTVATEGSTITTLTGSIGAAPTGTNMIGTRTLRLQTFGGLYGNLPTLRMDWNSVDGLVADAAFLTIAQAAATSGPWTVRSIASGTGAINPAGGNRTTATTGVGPIAITGDDYFGWNYVAPACAAPTAGTATSITSTSAVLNWTNGGTETLWNIKYNAGSFDPLAAGTLISGINAHPYTLNPPLVSSTTYVWYVQADCGGGITSAWAGPFTFMTLCPASTIPFTENFDSYTVPAVGCGTVIDQNADLVKWVTSTGSPYNGLNKLSIGYSAAGVTMNDWYITNGLTLTGGISYDVSFQYRVASSTWYENLEVKWGSTPTAAGMTSTAIFSTTNYNGQTYALGKGSFTPATTGTYYIGWHCFSAGDQDGIYLDQIDVIATPLCPIPINLTAAATGFQAILGWTEAGTATTWDIEYGTSSYVYTGTPNITPVTNPYTLTGLTPSTGYTYKVRANCGSGSLSPWSIAKTFTTTVACPAPTTLVSSAITTTQASVNWTSTGLEAAWDICYGPAGFVLNSDVGYDSIIGTSAKPYLLTGLLSSTTYDFYVRASCGAGSVSSWSALGTFTTACGDIATFPYMQTFEGATFPPACWTRFDGLLAAPSVLTATTSGWIQDDYRNVTSPVDKAARLNIWTTSTKYWFVTPAFVLTGSKQLEFDLSLNAYGTSTIAGLTGTDDKFAVVISTDGGTTWTSANTLRLWDNAGSAHVYNNISPGGEHVTIDLNAYSGSTVKIGFYGESTVSNADNDLMVNNVTIQTPLACPTPNTLTAVPAGHQANLGWTEAGTATYWDIEWGPSPFTPTGTPTLTNVSNPYTLTGLTPSTGYTYYVRAYCGYSHSPWSVAHSFTTTVSCPAPSTLVFTDVKTNKATANWTSQGIETSWDIEYGPAGFVAGSGTGYTEVLGTIEKPYNLTGLSVATTYDFYVRASCGEGEVSAWSTKGTFTTLCDVVTAPFLQDFEAATFAPTCWANTIVLGTYSWTRSTAASGNGAGAASAFADFYNQSSGTYDLKTMQFDISGMTSPLLKFNWAYATYAGEVDQMNVYYSTNAGATWILLKAMPGGSAPAILNTGGTTTSAFVPTAAQWGTQTLALVAGTNMVKFTAISAYGNSLYLDNVQVFEIVPHDVATVSIDVNSILPASSTAPQATFKNEGTNTETFNVTLSSTPAGYSSTKTITALAPGLTEQVTFDSWTPTAGSFTLQACTDLLPVIDGNMANNCSSKAITVFAGGAGLWSAGSVYPTTTYLSSGVGYTDNSVVPPVGYLYSFGGNTASALGTECYKYNSNTDTWSAIASLPAKRLIMASAIVNGDIFVIGGSNSTTYANTVYRYNIATDAWVTMPSVLPASIGWCKAVAHGTDIYVAGGVDNASTVLSSVYRYNTLTDTWTTATSMPGAKFGGAFSVTGNKLVYVAGADLYVISNSVYVGTITSPDVISWVSAKSSYPGNTAFQPSSNVSLTAENINQTGTNSPTKANYPGGTMYRFDAAPWGTDGIIIAAGSPTSAWLPAVPNPCFVYKPATDSWVIEPNLVVPVLGPSLGSVNLSSAGVNTWKLIVAGGLTTTGTTTATQILTETFAPSVTFQVNMSQQTVSPLGVHIAGSFQGWNPSATILTDMGSGVWAVTLPLAAGTYQYKFVNGNAWGSDESVPGACNFDGNRFFTVSVSETLPLVCFGSCSNCVTQVPLTLTVDMANQTVSANGVHVTGSFQGWNAGSTLMTQIPATTRYEATISVDENSTHQYKFINGNDWPGSENVPASCGVNNGFGGYNRTVTVTTGMYSAPVVCFNECSSCAPATKTLNLTAYLQGIYVGDGAMHKAQDENGDHFPGTVADQVTIELHDGTAPYDVAYTFNNVDLNTDGTLSIPTVSASASGSYYISIKHRNSVEIWSAAPISFSGSTISYNFSTASTQAYGFDAMVDIGGVFALFVGDVNQDGLVDGDDITIMDPDVILGSAGYLNTDLDGYGYVDGDDYVIIDPNIVIGPGIQRPY